VRTSPATGLEIPSRLPSRPDLHPRLPGEASVGAVLAWATPLLTEAGLSSPALEAHRLLQHATGLSEARVIAFPEAEVSPAQTEQFQALVLRRAERIPLAYVTGAASFLRWEFSVDERVMVPRPETEILVEAAASRLQGRRSGWVVDVGTGSGVVAISLALMVPHYRVLAVDVSQRALEVASRNIASHACGRRVFPVCGDLLSPLRPGVQGIVANLPYVPSAVLPTLQPEVARYEPRLALDGGQDGLALLRPLARAAAHYLSSGGFVALEVGAGQARNVEALLRTNPLVRRTQVIPDYAGIERVVIAFVDR